ncbi:hypothetical protein [Chitinophaga varians]|uniref:hypothetical protein n=1 Tax=Chitinophaga varians TaxID=2202339 RepID=UPI00165EF130|nr:hypothetical protein [Chitinophaga varians]MBC9912759.1 hypothetical protein [Chitinophaga varians]
MKNVITLMAIMLLLPALNPMSMAQLNCDELKKENESLKKALQITTPIKTITSSKIDFNLIKCEGNTKEQTVDVMLTLVNHDANQEFQFEEAKAIDIEANEYKTFNISIGSGSSRNKIYTDTPVKVVIKFTKVLPSVKIFKLIPISYFHDAPGRSVDIEYKDITISWK